MRKHERLSPNVSVSNTFPDTGSLAARQSTASRQGPARIALFGRTKNKKKRPQRTSTQHQAVFSWCFYFGAFSESVTAINAEEKWTHRKLGGTRERCHHRSRRRFNWTESVDWKQNRPNKRKVRLPGTECQLRRVAIVSGAVVSPTNRRPHRGVERSTPTFPKKRRSSQTARRCALVSIEGD